MASDTIAHCADCTTAEIEWCCAHPDQNYRGDPHKHCQISGEPNGSTRCEPGLHP